MIVIILGNTNQVDCQQSSVGVFSTSTKLRSGKFGFLAYCCFFLFFFAFEYKPNIVFYLQLQKRQRTNTFKERHVRHSNNPPRPSAQSSDAHNLSQHARSNEDKNLTNIFFSVSLDENSVLVSPFIFRNL